MHGHTETLTMQTSSVAQIPGDIFSRVGRERPRVRKGKGAGVVIFVKKNNH